MAIKNTIETKKIKTSEPIETKSKNSNTKKILLFLPWFLLLASITFSIYLWNQTQIIKKSVNTITPQEEVNNLVSKLSQLMVLPDETPAVATITDLNELKDQPFFVNAKVGDKVIIYSISKKAILYSPTQNKIIEVSSLGSSDESQTVSTTSKK